jgi:general secretion pathway protein F
MPMFRYKAVTADGLTLEGEMEAASQLAVVERLQSMGHLPIAADEYRKKGGSFLGIPIRGQRLSNDAIGHVTRELATLLDAGLPLDRSLEIARDLSENPTVAGLLGRLLDRIRGGASFTDALAQERDVFSRLYLSMVQAGEASGALGAVMKRLSLFLERAAALRETIKSALIYPAILLVVVLGSIIVLLTVVVPQFKPMFEDAGKQLPLATRIVVAAGDAVANYGWLAAAILAGAGILFKRQMAKDSVRRRRDGLLLHIPLVSSLLARFETARFTRTLSVLLQNGVSLVAALGIAKETVGNLVMREALGVVLGDVKEGRGLAEPLRKTELFPTLAVQLTRVGEETGRLDEMLMKAAEIYDGEVQRSIDRLLALLVPAITVGLGVLVAGIIASLLVAILSVNELAF